MVAVVGLAQTLAARHTDGGEDRDPDRRERRRLPHPRHLLRVRAGHRGHRPALGLGLARLLPLRALAARVGDRSGVHLGEPRRRRDHGDVGQRRRDRHRDGALLLDRRHPRDALPRRRDDAVLLRLEGALGPRVHVPAVRHRGAPRQRDLASRWRSCSSPASTSTCSARSCTRCSAGRCGSRSSSPRSSSCRTSPSAGSRRRSTTRCSSSSSSSRRCCRSSSSA